MALVTEERKKGRRHDAFGGEIEYLVKATGAELSGFDSEDAFAAVVATAPAEFEGIPASNVVVNEALIDLATIQVWSVSAIYSIREPTVFPTSSYQYDFDFQAPSGRIFYSLETRSITGYDQATSQPIAFPVTTFGGKIRGQNDDEDGDDLPNPSPTFSWTFNIPTGSVSLAYQMGVEAIMGFVNSAAFKSRAAETLRLVGCSGGARNDKDWSIRFSFQFSPNRTNVVIGGAVGNIVVPSIHGHNLVWDYTNPAIVSGIGTVHKPTAIIVERVFERTDFSVLGF
jgi:hypothetical protein